MTNRLSTYWRIWRILAVNAVQETFVNRGTNALFLLGKLIRLVMSLAFLFLFVNQIEEFAGYNTNQLYVFFIVYTLIDQVTQTLYRGVYMFAYQIRKGEFDFTLTRPVSSLFISLVGKPDINDALFFIPTLGVAIFLLGQLDLVVTPTSLLLFIAFFFNGLLIATAFHIFALAIGILTSEVDGVMWLYRDTSRLATFPVTIYAAPIRLFLFFVIPFGMMITIPAQALLGLPLSYSLILVLGIGILTLLLSLWFWRFALRHYTSASS